MKLARITAGPHTGTVAHITLRMPQLGLVNVTPIYGDPRASLQLRIHQVEFIHGHWKCSKCNAQGIRAKEHADCSRGAVFILEENYNAK